MTRMSEPTTLRIGAAWCAGYLSIVASVGYVLLYPGFFLYHFLVARGTIPPVLAGLYGYITVVISVLALLPLLLISRIIFSNRISVVYAIFIGYASLWLLFFGYAYPSNLSTPDINMQLAATILSMFALFIVGLFLNQKNKLLTGVMWAFFIFISGTTIYVYYVTGSVAVIFASFFNAGDEIATYQGFARSVMMLGIFLYALIKPTLWRAIFIVFTLYILFLLSSRSEAVAFAIGVMFVEAFLSGRRVASAFLILFAVGLVAFIASEHVDQIYNSRFRNIFSLGNDTSWNERNYLNDFAWRQIKDSPLIGEYGGHLLAGGQGYYAHSILSAWVSLGFAGIIMYAFLIFSSFYVSLMAFLRNMNNPRARLALSVSTMVVLLSLFSKPIFWGEPALAWGLAVSLLLANRRVQPNYRALQPRHPVAA